MKIPIGFKFILYIYTAKAGESLSFKMKTLIDIFNILTIKPLIKP